MEVLFDNAELAKTWPNARKMQQKYGTVRAKRLKMRMMQLEAAETLEEMQGLGRCHELTGDLAGYLALDLDHPYRLLIRPTEGIEPGPGGGLDWSAVRSIVVVDIVDYH